MRSCLPEMSLWLSAPYFCCLGCCLLIRSLAHPTTTTDLCLEQHTGATDRAREGLAFFSLQCWWVVLVRRVTHPVASGIGKATATPASSHNSCCVWWATRWVTREGPLTHSQPKYQAHTGLETVIPWQGVGVGGPLICQRLGWWACEKGRLTSLPLARLHILLSYWVLQTM